MQRRGGQRTSATRRRPARTLSPRTVLLVATRKGAFFFHANGARTQWRTDGPHFFGQIVNHVVLDPRDRRTTLAAVRPGHLGPSIYRSNDLGKTWQEAERPPAFRKAGPGEL